MKERRKLPSNWAEVTIDVLLQPFSDGRLLHHGWSPQCEAEPSPSDDEWGVLKTTAVQDGRFLAEHNKRLPPKLTPRSHLEVAAGDILITCAGPRNRCGVPCLVRSTRPKLILSGKMYRLRVRDAVMDAAYLEAFLRAKDTQDEIDRMKTGISDSGLNLTHDRFFRLTVPVAPLQEQKRIVASIEELFSDLDAGVAALKRAKANLRRYRAAVLKAAVEGKLTEEWRARHRAKEPASKLLARILQERRQKWEAEQLARFAAAKKEPPKNWREKYVEPAPPVTTGLPELPKGWCWAKLNALAEIRSGQTPTGILDVVRATGDIAWFKVGDMNHEENKVLMQNGKDWLTLHAASELGLHIHPKGTIIFPKRGGAIATNKKRMLAFDATFDLNTMGIVPYESIAHYIWLWFAGLNLATLSDGSNVPQINHQDIDPLAVPLPPLVEQRVIVAEVAAKLSQIEAAELQVEHSLARAARLRQSILKQAFEGKLVPQDPTDEPARVLLERLQANRSGNDRNGTATTQSRPRGRRRKSKTTGREV